MLSRVDTNKGANVKDAKETWSMGARAFMRPLRTTAVTPVLADGARLTNT